MKIAKLILKGLPALVVALGALFSAAACLAADWPSKPLKLIVPWPAGGPTDVASRVIGQELSQRLGQPIVIENKPGASGSIGTLQVVRSQPDGYTFTMMATPTLLAHFLYKGSTTVDVSKDLAPVATTYDLPLVLVVNPKVLPGVKTLPDLIAKIKSEGGKFQYTTSAPGSIGHVGMALLQDEGGFQMQHIPYKGGPAAMTDLLGGQVGMMFGDLVVALPHIRSGKLIALAVGSSQRIPQLPDTKTLAEQGFKDFEAVAWAGVLAPLNTPKPIVDRLNTELQQILAKKDIQDRLIQAGTLPFYQDAQTMSVRLKNDSQKWGKVIREKNILPE